MNSQCTQILVNIGVSNRFNLESLEEVYLGINSACNNYGVDLVGGDTTSSNKSLIISFLGVEFLNFQINLSLSMIAMKMLQHSLSWEIF